MAAKALPASAVGLPRFTVPEPADGSVFDLSSHQRAREALQFGLSINDPGFNIFVVGEDRSSRMTSTLSFLEAAVSDRSGPGDWLYLNNFQHPNRPKPYRVSAGIGRQFRERMSALIPQLREQLSKTLSDRSYESEVRAAGEKLETSVAQRMDALRQEAETRGLKLVQTQEGIQILALGPDGEPLAIDEAPAEQREPLRDSASEISQAMSEIVRWAGEQRAEFMTWVREHSKAVAESAIGTLLDGLELEFRSHAKLSRWLVELRVDIGEHLHLFQPPQQGAGLEAETPERRYAVNLLVDNADSKRPSVILEPNPTYENLFGRIEYRPGGGGLQTDFSMIRGGALHRANGGILVLRADALAASPGAWVALKGALRDRRIQIEERHRSGAVPMSEAPRPKPVALDVKVVIIGAPKWYYTFFSVDPDFQTQFKIKADIDPDLDATPENLACYAGLLREMAGKLGADCDEAAIGRLLGHAARAADQRDKLTARIELLHDILTEAAQLSGEPGRTLVTEALVADAVANRRRRNARIEDRAQEQITRGAILIDTQGAVIGQVNGLTVRSIGDHTFGSPARVTARASVGRRGVINIERDVELGGPIQQKGAMVLQGFLSGHFARRMPLSFNCSITFEQNYGGVEGDSASLAELLAILSDLAHLPLRQDLAITGSVNQRGQSQAVGGVMHKIEGFYRACAEAGALSGTQGVVLPAANETHVILRDELADAVADGQFHVWSVTRVEEAIELFMGRPAGEPDTDGTYPADSVFGLVMTQLEAFDRILAERER